MLTITSRNVSVDLDTSALSADIRDRIFTYGAQQVIADAASQAVTVAVTSAHGDKAVPADHKEWIASPAGVKAIASATLALMTKKRDALLAGEWTQRGSGGVDERTLVMRSIVRIAFKTKVGAKSKNWAKFDKLDDDKQNAKLAEWYAANSAAFDPAIDERIAERAKAREAKAKLANATTFAI